MHMWIGNVKRGPKFSSLTLQFCGLLSLWYDNYVGMSDRYGYTGEDLTKLRVRHGLTKRELAFELGVHENSIRSYEAAREGELPKVFRMALSAWLVGLPPAARERLQ